MSNLFRRLTSGTLLSDEIPTLMVPVLEETELSRNYYSSTFMSRYIVWFKVT